MKALIADSSPVVRRVLRGILQHHCRITDVIEARDGFMAAEAIRDYEFNLVFLDWNLAKRNGLDTMREIRALGYRNPVFMIMPESDRQHFADAVAQGASNYIIKPVKMRVAAEKINKTIEIQSEDI